MSEGGPPVPQPDLYRRLADATMVLDLLGTLPELTDEGQVIESIRDLFERLCGARRTTFRRHEEPGEPVTVTVAGFALPVTHAGQRLGTLHVDDIACPEYLPHYRSFGGAVAQVCGLALHNARTYRRLDEALRERERAERAVRELNRELDHRVRQVEATNRELDAFVYSASHDLRAPLRALRGFSEALLEDHRPALTGEAGVYLDQIIEAARGMNELVDGLLRLARSTKGGLHLEKVELSVSAAQIAKRLETGDPTRAVRWSIEPGLVVTGDTAMLGVVLENLMGNAWKYTARVAEASIRLRAQREGAHTWYRVEDNGAGFDPRYAAKLFAPFQRLHRQDEFPGIGIGLATVQRIIHRHGGEVRAHSEPGQGAVFGFTLPAGSEDGVADHG